jgi:peptidoglycan/xylan/chitin deacetylase (PgdA/CDA1 family)
MSTKLFSFRWDIDHRACMTDGMPRVMQVCREFGVANTFFVNMGRSTNLREWLGKGIRGSRAKLNDMEAVNLIEKIGWPRFVLETILSRPVGRSFVRELASAQEQGHELGLHGGSDHVVWSRRFAQIPEDTLAADVAATLEEFTRDFGKPVGFTCPGFKHDERTSRLVARLGFRYDGDEIGGVPHHPSVDGRQLDHWTIPVTVCGPRTIPFLEWHGARGSSDDVIVEDLMQRIASEDWVVLYGHPCYEGVNDRVLRRVFAAVRAAGYEFVTHAQMAERLYARA